MKLQENITNLIGDAYSPEVAMTVMYLALMQEEYPIDPEFELELTEEGRKLMDGFYPDPQTLLNLLKILKDGGVISKYYVGNMIIVHREDRNRQSFNSSYFH